MLTGYDDIKNLYSVSATPELLLEWNANKFGNAIIAGTTNYPTNAMLSSQYLFTTGTTSNRDNTSSNDYTTTVTTYTSTAYSNISSGGKGSIFSDSSFQVIRSTNAINGSSGYDCPIDATAAFDISRLFSGITDRQRQYGIKVSFWVKTTYSSSKPNVSPEINLFVTADIPNSNSTTAPRVSGSKTEMSTVKVNAAKWTQINLDITPEILLSSTIIRYLRLNIRSESFLDSFPEIAIDDVQIFRVSKRQSKKVDNYNNVSALFSTNRPGEYLVRYDEDGLNVQEGQSCHGTPIDVGFGVGTQADFDISKVALYDDNYISNNNFSSYITSTWDEDSLLDEQLGGSDRIWTLYEKEFPVNKIVIKQNSNLSYCSSKVYVLTKSGSTFTWTLAGTVTPNWNGIDILYYNGSTWSSTKWTTRPNIDNGTISTYINICGIYIEPTQFVTRPTYGNAWNNTAIFDPAKIKLQFIEISARLQVEVTNYLQSYRIVKEISADDDPLPIGQATSNSLTLTMNNLPIIKNSADPPNYSSNDDIIIFNNDSTTSPITSLLQKDCQCFLYLNINGTRIPQFTGYINDWSISENDAAAQAYDIVKIFQDRNVPSTKVTINNCLVNFAVEVTLRNAGINDFNLAALKLLSFNSQTYQSKKIKYYWMEKDENGADCLDELAKIYQIIIYADEYGKIIINSLSNIINSSTVSASITDVASSTILPNIISVSEITRPVPKTLAINYNIASPPTINTGSILLNNSVPIWQPDSEVIALSNVELAQRLLVGDTSLYLTDISTFLNGLYDYQGYFIIDREIIYYNGIEHNIYYKLSGNPAWYPYGDGKITIYGQDNLKYYEDLILSGGPSTGITGVSITPNAVLKNLQRGMFGTTESNHGIDAPLPSYVKYRDIDKNTSGTFDSYNESFSLSNQNNNAIIYTRSGNSTPSIYIPANQSLYVAQNFKDQNWNYFRSIQKVVNNPSKTVSPNNRVYTGIFIGNNSSNSLFIGVGTKKSGVTEQSIIVKPTDSLGQSFELNENDFGTSFINPSGSLSEAIKFEVFLGTNDGKPTAKIYINNTLITSSTVFSIDNKSNPSASAISFSNSNELYLSTEKSVGFGVFTWSADASNVGTQLYEMSFSNQDDKINYLGLNQQTYNEEKILIDNVIDNIDTNGLTAGYTPPSYFIWTGTKNIRQLKIFDVDLDQIPIQTGYSKLFTGSFSYEITALKNNYI